MEHDVDEYREVRNSENRKTSTSNRLLVAAIRGLTSDTHNVKGLAGGNELKTVVR